MQPYPTWQNIYSQMQNTYPTVPINNTIPGKYVNNFSEVTASDVPMNGVSGIFVKMDLSEIQLKKWESNGTISTRVFKSVLTQNPNNESSNNQKPEIGALESFLGTFEEEMKVINDKLDRLQKNGKQKKEVSEDE